MRPVEGILPYLKNTMFFMPAQQQDAAIATGLGRSPGARLPCLAFCLVIIFHQSQQSILSETKKLIDKKLSWFIYDLITLRIFKII
jgi:hypothetical protein